MKAMALAAGKGTRLFPLTGEIPKPMAPVVNTPIIEHIFDLLARPRHRRGQRQRPLPGRRAACSLRRRLQGERHGHPPGEGRRAARHGRGRQASGRQVRRHLRRRLRRRADRRKHKGAGRTITRRKAPWPRSRCAGSTTPRSSGWSKWTRRGTSRVSRRSPTPEEAISTLANTGIYVFEPQGPRLHPGGHLLRLRQGRVPEAIWRTGSASSGIREDFYWSDIGTLEAYRQAQYDVLSGKVGVKIPGEKRGEGLWVGEDAQIHSSAEIEGHVLVGRDAVVGRGVKLSET